MDSPNPDLEDRSLSKLSTCTEALMQHPTPQIDHPEQYQRRSDYGGGGLMVITRPKGGRRALCMNMEEVKACNELGFELEHECMMESPGSSRISLSGSTFDDTSSGGSSPMASWRIPSPGDDPRDVKARLKVWAQAVAIVSTSSVSKY